MSEVKNNNSITEAVEENKAEVLPSKAYKTILVPEEYAYGIPDNMAEKYRL